MEGEKIADKAVGRTRGGLNTKLHAIVDGLGNPVEFMLSAGNDHDSVHAVELLEKVEISGSNVLADRAYGAKAIRAYISGQGACYVIPPQSNVSDPWPVDWWLYKERHLGPAGKVEYIINNNVYCGYWHCLYMYRFGNSCFLNFKKAPKCRVIAEKP